MKTLVLLSELTRNKKIEDKLESLFSGKTFKLGYIPSRSDKTRKYFDNAQDFFKNVGVDELLYFDVDEEFDESLIKDLKMCDGIYLSGGNTFYFLKKLRESNMLCLIREFVKEGKILMGVSAGSILMSKTIDMAHLLDDNLVDLKDLTSLGLVDFEVLPHWNDQLNLLGEHHQNTIFCLHDGDGIFIQGEKMDIIGNVREIKGEL
ncbi:Type 1 glutamine amidotransferase-like domain-containing protein [Bacillus suaedaesalsae]|uniref:Type 1 glutamine amidotransferase-like domain-containing protein n=1 Tax=Bacillus suaedaesalsae TaxID=2810349 RepID=A0ABS2DHL5_9BACI|nr:Type 1 glutamine amidotransferase-like domain-containing protein [Bacillus suaedaesalsae]MBM6617977.1 Type 1 glutamine amidotransferase-like domain-containing protein [Bacillus suaedaesalsae]